MSMSFTEKSAWIQMASMGLVLGGYFVVAGRMMASGVDVLPAYVPLFVVTVVAMVVVQIAGHILAAVTGRTEGPDERDRVIGWRADSNSSWLLGAGVLVGITAMVFGMSDVWVAHLLLFSLFASQLLEYALQLYYYRRGF